MLAIQQYIKQHGLQQAVEKFSLISKDYGHKILLKYNQIDSPFSEQEVQDSRGIILEKDTWKVMSLAFRKFFNSGEIHAAPIDWDSAIVFTKEDGSLIQVYFDWVLQQWCVGTSGTADANTPVNNDEQHTFSSLFWNTAKKYDLTTDKLDTRLIYVFELCTPYNIVVTPHTESKIVLLGVRNQDTLSECLPGLSYIGTLTSICNEIGVGLPVIHKLSDLNSIASTFNNMPFDEEGYVVVDKNCNRIKIKNPSYVAAHHLKSKTAAHHIMEIIKQNEVDEFAATFAERKTEILELQAKYYKLIESGEKLLAENDIVAITTDQIKEKALLIQEIAVGDLQVFRPLLFKYMRSIFIPVSEYVKDLENKKLYELLKH